MHNGQLEGPLLWLWQFFCLAGLGYLAHLLYKKINWSGFKLEPSPSAKLGAAFICTQCGSQGQTLKMLKGSGGIELLLWVLVLSWPFALVYSVWRRTGNAKSCEVCGGTLIPVNTPLGQQLLKKFAV